jgi:DNA-binding CsgD family transcriptional regulator/tetratricopeptide (TPR) repeat protein
MTSVDRPSPPGLVGRDAELDRLRALVVPAPDESRVLVVLGEAGMGKTVLLADVAGRAGAAGMRVLSVTGRESESTLAFAGLHQLLRPVVDQISGLPKRQASALLGALGLAQDPVVPDRLLTGIAVLTLLSDLSEASGVLVVVDDAHWLDRSSLDALAFAGHRLDSEPVVLLLGVRGSAPPAGFDRDLPELHLQPLALLQANLLLDQQPHPPHGRARRQVLAQAAGNPMALIELARAIAADPAAGRHWDAEPLPLTDRLSAIIAAQLGRLPAPIRHALLLAAVADSADLVTAATGRAGLEPGGLVPAEQLGLIKVDTSGVRFTHPLVRSAVYYNAPFAQRAAAHREVAAALADQPDRQAWHLAAAAVGPDEHVASLLAATASQAQRRGGASAAAQTLERAAELSPDPDTQAQRLVAAAMVAAPTGQTGWVQDLATRALALTTEPALGLTARRLVGWALAWSSRHAAALSALLPVAREAARFDPLMAWDALAFAASVAYQSAEPDGVQAVRETLALLEDTPQPSLDPAQLPAVEALRLWIRAVTGPYRDRAELLARLDQVAQAPLGEHYLSRAGATAWVLDQSDRAVGLLQAGRNQLQEPTVRAASGGSLSPLGWAFLDAGRWDDALEAAAEADDLSTGHQLDVVSPSADLIAGTVLAARGDGDAARARISGALERDPEQSRSVTARARHALGLAALADGDYLMAYGQLRQLFADDGAPWHYHVSYLGVADLAAAAARADRRIEARDLLRRIQARLDGRPSPRLDQLLGRAWGLLADPSSPDTRFDMTLSDPAGDRWPFERAQLRLDHGEWLRRHRRINDAKPVLAAALEALRQLRARPWMQRAETELRACGVAVPGVPAQPDVLWQLTPQQRQIISLAGHGYTNRQIADRLFLSPRTVASHLYRSYPKLGISGRHQLHDLVTRAGMAPEADPGP